MQESNRRKGCRQEEYTHQLHPSCPPFSPQLDVKGCRDVYASFERYCDVELMDGPNQYKAEGHGLQVCGGGVRRCGEVFMDGLNQYICGVARPGCVCGEVCGSVDPCPSFQGDGLCQHTVADKHCLQVSDAWCSVNTAQGSSNAACLLLS